MAPLAIGILLKPSCRALSFRDHECQRLMMHVVDVINAVAATMETITWFLLVYEMGSIDQNMGRKRMHEDEIDDRPIVAAACVYVCV